jgi:hypothetical protein
LANYPRLINAINDAANQWLPDGYSLGYHLSHDSRLLPNDPALPNAPEDLAVVDEGSAEMLAHWREELTRDVAAGVPGAADDLAALPTSGRHLLVEIMHPETGIRAVRTYAYSTIRDLATNDALTAAQKRTQIRNALQSLYTLCQTRVDAAT